jgi:DNA-binding XRE family transcriptional regulator
MANAGIPSDYLIKQRRRQEDFRAYYEDAKKTQDRVAKKAEWENKTNKVIEENRLQGRVSALQAQVDGHLETRRQRCHPSTHTQNPRPVRAPVEWTCD